MKSKMTANSQLLTTTTKTFHQCLRRIHFNDILFQGWGWGASLFTIPIPHPHPTLVTSVLRFLPSSTQLLNCHINFNKFKINS